MLLLFVAIAAAPVTKTVKETKTADYTPSFVMNGTIQFKLDNEVSFMGEPSCQNGDNPIIIEFPDGSANAYCNVNGMREQFRRPCGYCPWYQK